MGIQQHYSTLDATPVEIDIFSIGKQMIAEGALKYQTAIFHQVENPECFEARAYLQSRHPKGDVKIVATLTMYPDGLAMMYLEPYPYLKDDELPSAHVKYVLSCVNFFSFFADLQDYFFLRGCKEFSCVTLWQGMDGQPVFS